MVKKKGKKKTEKDAKISFRSLFLADEILLIWRSSYFKIHAFSSLCANVYFRIEIFYFYLAFMRE